MRWYVKRLVVFTSTWALAFSAAAAEKGSSTESLLSDAPPTTTSSTTVPLADAPAPPPNCDALLESAKQNDPPAARALAEKRWQDALNGYSTAHQIARQAETVCAGEAQTHARALVQKLTGDIERTTETRLRLEVCRPAIDKALALDVQAGAARNGKREIGEIERLYAQAESIWREAVDNCRGKDQTRAKAGLADTAQAHADIREISESGKECDEAWRTAEAMVDLGKAAWADRRWKDSAQLYRKAAIGWDVAEEKCATGDRHVQAHKKQDSAETDAHNALNCAPRWDEARELSQRLKVEGQVLQAKDRNELSMRTEALWRTEAENCRGPAKDKAKSNADAIAKDRGTPLDGAILQQAMASAKPKPIAPPSERTESRPSTPPIPSDSPGIKPEVIASAAPLERLNQLPRGPQSEPTLPSVSVPAGVTAAHDLAPMPIGTPAISASTVVSVPADESGGQQPAETSQKAAVPEGMAHLTRIKPNVFKLDGITYEGNFQLDSDTKTLSGTGMVTWENGDIFEGTIVHGDRQGKGRFAWKNGQVYEGDWTSNRMEGKADIKYPDGNHYIGQVKDGVRHGRGTLLYGSGDVFEGDFREDHIDGLGRFTWKNGDYYEGAWKKDKKDGQGAYVWASGVRSTGIFKDGVLVSDVK